MLERVIVLPLRDNAGLSLARQLREVRREILAIAGGYSEVKQRGAWLDDGAVYRDLAWRITSTVTPEQDARLVERIPAWCVALRQLCVYTHASEVSSDFVYPVVQETATSVQAIA